MKHNNNFKQRVLTFALAAVFAIGGGFFAVNSYADTGTGNATATVVEPIAIANANPNLRFGSFATSGGTDTVVIAAETGGRTLTGALEVGTGQNAFGAASFAVSGEESLTYAITLPDNGVVTIAGAGDPMAVSAFTSFPSDAGTLDGSGNQILLVAQP